MIFQFEVYESLGSHAGEVSKERKPGQKAGTSGIGGNYLRK